MTDQGVSAANALLDRKMKLAEHLGCKDLLGLASTQTTSLIEVMRRESEMSLALNQAKRELDDCEAMAEINAPGGSNETERKRNRVAAVKEDEACKQAQMVVSNRERDLSLAKMDVEAIKKQLKITELTIDYRIAAMQLLAG